MLISKSKELKIFDLIRLENLSEAVKALHTKHDSQVQQLREKDVAIQVQKKINCYAKVYLFHVLGTSRRIFHSAASTYNCRGKEHQVKYRKQTADNTLVNENERRSRENE